MKKHTVVIEDATGHALYGYHGNMYAAELAIGQTAIEYHDGREQGRRERYV